MKTTLILIAALFIVGAQAAEVSLASNQVQERVQGPQQVLVATVPAQQSPQGVEVHQVNSSPVTQQRYVPSGLVTVVGSEQPQQAVVKPVQVTRSSEQYGQSEQQYGLPPNYKPFGSWGLYIGGNPADGHYTNYYKSLSGGLVGEKQEKPLTVLKAAAPSSVESSAYYPYSYQQAEYSPVYNQHSLVHPVSSQYYGSPSYETYEHASPEVYSPVKKVVPYVQKELAKVDSKSYVYPQSRVYSYVYSSPVVSQAVAPAVVPVKAQVQEQQQQQQVLSYPVGSQIVGSQAGVDGSFQPYGVHAFTRYRVPAQEVQAVQQHSPSNENVYLSQASVQPSYNRVYYSGGYVPLSYYGYPLNQLHYSRPQVGVSQEGQEHYQSFGYPQNVKPVESKPVEELKVVEAPSLEKSS